MTSTTNDKLFYNIRQCLIILDIYITRGDDHFGHVRRSQDETYPAGVPPALLSNDWLSTEKIGVATNVRRLKYIFYFE